MPESDQSEVLRQLAVIRRELRLVRGMLFFVSVALGIFLFAPSWAAWLAVWTALLVGHALPFIGFVAGFVAVAMFAAMVVSRYAPSLPSTPTSAAENPAAPIMHSEGQQGDSGF